MTDIWVCGTCHSINRQRTASCYKCGAPQSAATGEGATHRVEQALAARAVVRYRSAWLRGLIASFFILMVAALGVVLVLLSFDDVAWARDQLGGIVAGGTFDQAEYLERNADEIPIGLARFGALILALLFFGAWLSRVIMNIPALGGGVPSKSPTKAFIYPLIPIVNLLKVPGMIQDALYRVDPRAGGFFMVALAWFGLVGSWIVGFIASWVINVILIGDLGRAETPAELTKALVNAFDLLFALEVGQLLMVSVGSLILVGIMMRIERRSSARDREIREAALASIPQAGSVEARPGAVAYDAAADRPVASPAPSAAPSAPAAPFAPASVPAATPSFAQPTAVAGPLGSMPAAHGSDPILNRPITAVTGAASIPTPVEAPTFATEPAPAAHVPTGPNLHLRIESATSMVATLDGESETITLDDLPEAASALARANGSAVIATGAPDQEAGAVADRALRILADAGVPTTTGD